MSQTLKDKVQKVQNNCLRFSFGLRKYDHISSHRRQEDMLNMNNRRIVHSLSMLYKIINKLAPEYLYRRIATRSSFHNHNTRIRLALDVRNVRSSKKKNSFFINIPKLYNEISLHLELPCKTILTFKNKCKKYYLNLEKENHNL